MVTGVGKGLSGYYYFSFPLSSFYLLALLLLSSPSPLFLSSSQLIDCHDRLVTKPLAGVIDMGVKTTQGVINTPGTIGRAAKMSFADGIH